MKARIFQKPKNAMQSGRAGTQRWFLEYAPAEARKADPLMGWAGSGDTRRQFRLSFATREEANAYAAKNGIEVGVMPPPMSTLKIHKTSMVPPMPIRARVQPNVQLSMASPDYGIKPFLRKDGVIR